MLGMYAFYQPYTVVNSIFFDAKNAAARAFCALKPNGKVEDINRKNKTDY